jgi:serine protease Do
MKNLIFKGFTFLTALCIVSSVYSTPEGVEKILFSDKKEQKQLPKEELTANAGELASAPPATKNSSNDCVCSAKVLSKAFTQVAKKSTPAVVHIRVEGIADNECSAENDPFGFFNDEFFRRFFDNPNRQPRQPQPQISQGSGFFISVDGHIMTNYHVVANAKQITVVVQDDSNGESELKANFIGGDPQTDVAILKVDSPDHKTFPYLEFGNSDDVEICEFVIAIGSPFQLEATVTVGVISAKGRQNLKITELEDFIQTDAAINPGNSGGPLLDLDGHVIGMNTAIVSRSGGYMGIGFAIPSNIAKNVSRQIIDKGSVTRGFLGVSLQPIDKDLAEALGLEKPEGALVADIVPDSPAAQAGLEQGDIILEVNDIPVKTPASIRNDVMLNEPGTVVKLKVNRKGKVMIIKVTLGSYNKSTMAASETAQILGITVDNLTPVNIKNYRLNSNEEGVVITDVKQGSMGARMGLKPGYVVVSLNHKKLSNVESFNEALASVEKGKKVLLLVKYGDVARFFSIKLG